MTAEILGVDFMQTTIGNFSFPRLRFVFRHHQVHIDPISKGENWPIGPPMLGKIVIHHIYCGRGRFLASNASCFSRFLRSFAAALAVARSALFRNVCPSAKTVLKLLTSAPCCAAHLTVRLNHD